MPTVHLGVRIAAQDDAYVDPERASVPSGAASGRTAASGARARRRVCACRCRAGLVGASTVPTGCGTGVACRVCRPGPTESEPAAGRGVRARGRGRRARAGDRRLTPARSHADGRRAGRRER